MHILVMVKNRALYILIYTLIFIIPIILSAFIGGSFSLLWENMSFYIPYWIIGGIFLFGNKEIRNLALLFQVAASLKWLLYIVAFPVLCSNENAFIFIKVLLFLSLFYVWYFYCPFIFVWKIWVTLLFTILFSYILLVIHDRLVDSFVSTFAGTISFDAVLVLGWTVIAILCTLRIRKKVWIIICFLVGLSFLSAFYLYENIYTKLVYGSPVSDIEQPVLLEVKASNLSLEKDLSKKYNVCFIWEKGNKNIYFFMKKFECLYWKYRNYRDVSFCVIAFDQINNDKSRASIYREYTKYGFEIPFCVIQDSTSFRKEVGVITKGRELVCIFRDNMLFYKNDVSMAGEYLNKILVE